MEGASSDEQDVIRAHHSVARVDSSAFDHWQDIPLYALSRNIRTMAAFAAGDLIYLIQEDDSCILHPINRHSRDLIHINEALLFFLNQVLESFIHLHLPLFRALAEDVRKHVLNVDVHLLDTLIGDDLEGREIALPDVDFHHAIIEFALAELLPEFFPRAALRFGHGSGTVKHYAPSTGISRPRRRGWQENIQETLFGVQFCLIRYVFQLFLPNILNRDFHQIANHGFHITPDVTDLGKLRSLDFQKRGVGQLRQPTGNLGLTHAGWPNHDDVLWDHFIGHVLRQFLAAHAVAQCDTDRALGIFLADNIFVQFRHNLARRELVKRSGGFFSGSW